MRDIKSLKFSIEKQLLQPLEKVSIVNLVDHFIEYAYLLRASDIHIQPGEKRLRIRFRVDGILQDMFDNIGISMDLQPEIISRIKVLSGLRTDEHNEPQDGRFKAKVEETGGIDIRVSIAPTYYGENAVLRILAESHKFELETLGFSEADLQKIRKAIGKPYGMILANGPTGSGKSTTLYAILKKLNKDDVSIITIEDPVEYSLEGTNQIQVNPQVGLTFATGLRSILRQDPNIIMVGEIRDEETAGIAVNAALTGHLLLSTLHTNDAATTFPRLIDMGVPPFLVASTVNIVMGQRLVRRLCQICRTERKLTSGETKSLGELIPEIKNNKWLLRVTAGCASCGTAPRARFFSAKGCDSCNGTGYQGRIGIQEVLEVNDAIRQLIMKHANAKEIKDAAVKSGMITMLEDGLHKAVEGLTTVEEILRIIHE